MADVTSSIFNKKAAEKLRSPDDLDKYVQVTNPGIWVVLLACIALLAGLLAWGIFGAVDTNIVVKGAVATVHYDEGDALAPICFLSDEEVAEVSVGDTALVEGVQMTVSSVAQTPMSIDEVKTMLNSDYLTSALVKSDWVYVIVFEGDASNMSEGVPISINITVDHVSPISLIFRGNG